MRQRENQDKLGFRRLDQSNTPCVSGKEAPFRAKVVLAAMLFFATPIFAQRIIYVDDDAVGLETGENWKNGYPDLQDALDDARDVGGCPCEVWVAEGTYKPDRGTGNRLMLYDMMSGVGVYGGFAGCETGREQRIPGMNETILNGDLNGDDDLDLEPTNGCCIALTKYGCEDVTCREAVIDRFSQCERVWDSLCVHVAEELCCELCVPTFCDNSVGLVRALDTDATAVLDGVTMTRAHPRGAPEGFVGGGAFLGRDSDVQVNGCIVRENLWGVSSIQRGAPRITNTLFSRNRAFITMLVSTSSPEISGCQFVDNEGTGLLISDDVVVRDCLFMRNRNGGLALDQVASAVGCTFIDNQAWSGAGASGTGVHTIADCVFLGNRAENSGGAVSINAGLVINSVFVGNKAGREDLLGGASGAAIVGGLGTVAIINSTVFANTAGASVGSGIFTNSIFWANETSNGERAESIQVRGGTGDVLDISYSIVEGWTGDLGGVGNSGVDPMFVDADGPDDIPGTEDDNLRLLPGSPAIKAGDPVGFVGPASDLDGHPRTMCSRRDIGAYEFGIGDYDCDQTVDLWDFSAWDSCASGPEGAPYTEDCKAFDFNTDKLIDLFDFAGFQRLYQIP